MAITAIACFVIISLSTLTLSCVQVAKSTNVQNTKNAAGTITQSDDSANQQAFNSNNQQASRSETIKNSGNVDNSCKIQDEQTPNKNESATSSTETNQGRISELPLPIPDGRIFLGAEDPIPYIPTENPKACTRIPILPPELDS
jgi:hypothetical protein